MLSTFESFTHCPKCGRALQWFETRPGCGHGEGLYTDSHGELVCGDCIGKSRYFGDTLADLNRRRARGE